MTGASQPSHGALRWLKAIGTFRELAYYELESIRALVRRVTTHHGMEVYYET